MLFAATFKPYILEERDSILAVFKPAGWHSVSQGDRDGGGARESIVDWLVSRRAELADRSQLADTIDARVSGRPSSKERFFDELGMLYRLDFETSGILLFALTREAFERLRQAQDRLALEKRYILVCSESSGALPGSLPPSMAMERAALLRDVRAGRERRVTSYFRPYGVRGARVACIAEEFLAKTHKKTAHHLYETSYLRSRDLGAEATSGMRAIKTAGEALRSISGDSNAALVECGIQRGFRHQIRAHSAWIGLPIVGDRLYGGAEASRLMLEAFSVRLWEGGKLVEEWNLRGGIADLLGESI